MTTPAPQSAPGNMATFNIHHGFPEALVRGMRSSFLADSDYHHLTQCENLDDFRLNLSETDYSEGIQDNAALTPTSLQSAAVEKVSFLFVSRSIGVWRFCMHVRRWRWNINIIGRLVPERRIR